MQRRTVVCAREIFYGGVVTTISNSHGHRTMSRRCSTHRCTNHHCSTLLLRRQHPRHCKGQYLGCIRRCPSTHLTGVFVCSSSKSDGTAVVNYKPVTSARSYNAGGVRGSLCHCKTLLATHQNTRTRPSRRPGPRSYSVQQQTAPALQRSPSQFDRTCRTRLTSLVVLLLHPCATVHGHGSGTA